MLTKIEGREVALRDTIERGYYIGLNASYNVKQLVEADYVVQKRSAHDKRSVKVSLTEKGEELHKKTWWSLTPPNLRGLPAARKKRHSSMQRSIFRVIWRTAGRNTFVTAASETQ